ncbi:hypothetical protein LZG75_03385 [Polynucleobacter sp. IMCC30063]|uniref:hypothetical protein n=1 Tax=Polynucleobacter sp. IMCC30063 TaxID=2907298 RepID=UPI001F1E535B|nr:hypothetical protein [Polynucleobacter sp. IMCC30063]MCE7505273.1 hypothetical protein [Polynucleobacter sp. IMCC30063]
MNLQNKIDEIRFQKIITFTFFTIIFISTLNNAYLSGDDFVSISGQIWRDVYIPSFSKTWIPNRVFDPFGQALFTYVLDFLYFPLNNIFGLSFFWVHKILSAVFFSSFLTVVYLYIVNFINLYNDNKNDKAFLILVNISIAIGIASILPWQNHTYIISYEVPAFLSFLLLVEIIKILYPRGVDAGTQKNQILRPPSALFLVLIYVCVFSLEAYCLILALTFFSMVAFNFINKLTKNRYPYINSFRFLAERQVISFYAICFILLTMYCMFLILNFSERIRTKGQILISGFQFSINSIIPSDNNWLLMFAKSHGIFIIGITCIYLLLFYVYKRLNIVFSFKHYFVNGPMLSILIMTGISLSLASFIIIACLSKFTSLNFFNFNIYPWGALFLPAKLYLILFFSFFAINLNSRIWPIKSFIALLIFILTTQYLMLFFSFYERNSNRALLVERAYNLTIQNPNKFAVIDTKIELHNIEGAKLPFPAYDSPSWLTFTFGKMLKKYYGIEEMPSYK